MNDTTHYKHLYVIGNGFDLHHNINCSYTDFEAWLKENEPETALKIDDVYQIQDNEWWKDFENNLAYLKIEEYASNIASENQPDLMSEHCDRMWGDAQIAARQDLKRLFTDLRYAFHHWIMQLKKPNPDNMLKIAIKDSLFLSFNYTRTLEELYGIPGRLVTHIHGCVNENEEFILGHGKTSTEIDEFYDIHGVELHEQFALEATASTVAEQRKPVKELIERYHDFFKSLKNIEHIHVFGLSMSEIDIPYLSKIHDQAPEANWEFSDYRGKDIVSIENFAKKIDLNNYRIISLSDLCYNEQLTLDFTY